MVETQSKIIQTISVGLLYMYNHVNTVEWNGYEACRTSLLLYLWT